MRTVVSVMKIALPNSRNVQYSYICMSYLERMSETDTYILDYLARETSRQKMLRHIIEFVWCIHRYVTAYSVCIFINSEIRDMYNID